MRRPPASLNGSKRYFPEWLTIHLERMAMLPRTPFALTFFLDNFCRVDGHEHGNSLFERLGIVQTSTPCASC